MNITFILPGGALLGAGPEREATVLGRVVVALVVQMEADAGSPEEKPSSALVQGLDAGAARRVRGAHEVRRVRRILPSFRDSSLSSNQNPAQGFALVPPEIRVSPSSMSSIIDRSRSLPGSTARIQHGSPAPSPLPAPLSPPRHRLRRSGPRARRTLSKPKSCAHPEPEQRHRTSAGAPNESQHHLHFHVRISARFWSRRMSGWPPKWNDAPIESYGCHRSVSERPPAIPPRDGADRRSAQWIFTRIL